MLETQTKQPELVWVDYDGGGQKENGVLAFLCSDEPDLATALSAQVAGLLRDDASGDEWRQGTGQGPVGAGKDDAPRVHRRCRGVQHLRRRIDETWTRVRECAGAYDARVARQRHEARAYLRRLEQRLLATDAAANVLCARMAALQVEMLQERTRAHFAESRLAALLFGSGGGPEAATPTLPSLDASAAVDSNALRGLLGRPAPPPPRAQWGLGDK